MSEAEEEQARDRPPQVPNASEYMRSTRPELYSDSEAVDEVVLDRSHLEYHLDTLTNRKQEFVFEDFCRRLGELEICPNLKPQTGPVGGGDSKTDTSTYPVAGHLIERCYWGSPTAATDELWAFAFSCQKTWGAKVRSDLTKIAELPTAFSKAYFISSRFIRDKDRARVEEELAATHGIEVHILDRTWILDTVFAHGRELIAIESLNISVSRTSTRRLGPNDYARQGELDEILERLKSPFENYASDYFLAADYLSAAKLARGLEKPRHEVTGLYAQARRLSKKSGYVPQIIRCAYEHAWADNWWFDDVSTAIEAFDELEPLLQETDDADDVEMFVNLHGLMWQSVFREEFIPSDLKLWERETILRNKLLQLVGQSHKPNNSLYAESMLAFLDLAAWNDDRKEEGVRRLTDCFSRSRGLATYPLRRMTDAIMGVSEFIEGTPGYDELFEAVTSVLTEREGDIASAKLLLNRGTQHMDANRLPDAIRMLGRARKQATKEEILETAVRAANLAGLAYLRQGCFWAARMEALFALKFCCEEVDGGFRSPTRAYHAVKTLGHCELAQGRLAPFLGWMTIASECVGELAEDGVDISPFKKMHQDIESPLCSFLLSLDEATVGELLPLSDLMVQLNFPMAHFCLMYANGKSEDIEEDFTRIFEEDVEWMHEFFQDWIKQVRQAIDRIEPLHGLHEATTTLRTRILGVEFVIEVDSHFDQIAFSENLLGAIEAVFTCAKWENLAFMQESVLIRVSAAPEGTDPPAVDLHSSSDAEGLRLLWRDGPGEWLAKNGPHEFAEFLNRLLMPILVLSTIDPVDDLKKEIALWYEDGTFDRAFGMSPLLPHVADLIGKDCYDLGSIVTAASQTP